METTTLWIKYFQIAHIIHFLSILQHVDLLIVSFSFSALVLLVSAQPVYPPSLFTLYKLHPHYLCSHFATVLTQVRL